MRPGETRDVGNTRIKITKQESKFSQILPGSVAWSEAAHAVVAIKNGTGVKFATRVPGEDYEGLTVLTREDPLAMVAHFAMGGDGASYDVHMLEQMGHNASSLAPIARSILGSDEVGFRAAASTIEENGTVSGNEIERAMKEAHNKKEVVIVTLMHKDGTVNEYEKVMTDEEVVIFDRNLLNDNSMMGQKELELAA